MSATNEKISYVEAGQKGMNKTVENTTERAINSVLNFIRNKYGKACIAIGNAFKLYLKNAELRYNQVKTLADLSEPRILEGPKGIYVDVYIKYREEKLIVKTIENLKKISNNIIIIGSGGTGKSMLMRHLFVNTYHNGSYVPVLVELRKIADVQEKHALLDLIHDCIESFDVTLNQEQFEYSLRTGKYLFLFDGLDEVKAELCGKTEQLIQEISKKYPNNFYIVSSRKEGVIFNELETYTLVKACPFEKYQAIELVKKLGGNNEKILEFADLLDKELYEKHTDFASNPLLLTMMYITFLDNNLIPEHLTDFYERAYDALFRRHDANKEGLYKRDYQCKKLGDREFKDLFAYFCFQSYFVQEYEFSKEEICQYIKKGINKLNYNHLIDRPEMFFDDIKNIVCLIVEEGTKYKFAHRSFQTYFAAYYTSVYVTDEQQKIFFRKEIDHEYLTKEDFYFMLFRLESDRFNYNILEPGIKSILEKVESGGNPQFRLLQISCQGVQVSIHENKVFRQLNSSDYIDIPYERNIILLFEDLYYNIKYYGTNFVDKNIVNMDIVDKIIDLCKRHKIFSSTVTDLEIDALEINDLLKIRPLHVRDELLELIYQYFDIDSLLKMLRDFMKQQEDRKKKIEENKGRNELLSLL